jgi:hypothetical protein
MPRFERTPCLIALAVLAPLIGACASVSDIGQNGINLPRGDFFNSKAFSFSSRREDFALPPPAPGELIGPEGQCAGGAAAAAGTADGGGALGLLQGGIALQMTECDVVRRAGAPEKIEYPPNRFERAVMLTYIRGPRPGIYNFLGGRLVAIDRAPEPPAAPKPAKKSGRA